MVLASTQIHSQRVAASTLGSLSSPIRILKSQQKNLTVQEYLEMEASGLFTMVR